MKRFRAPELWLPIWLCLVSAAAGAEVPVAAVEGQPLAANVTRVLQTLDFLGASLPEDAVTRLQAAAALRDAQALQQLLDPHVLLVVSLNPEVRVKVTRGPATAILQQGGFTPVLVKVLNDSTVAHQLRIASPQSGAVYAGASLGSLQRQGQTELNENENKDRATDRFLQVEMFQSPPMTRELSGLEVEYAIALVYSHEAGKREATIGFDVGAGTQDLGFRGETPVLFEVRPAVGVRLSIRDYDGQPTAARLIFRDARGSVYPPQAKRVAPDFFFQPQIYRRDGDTVWLPSGKFSVEYCRGPEYRVLRRDVVIPAAERANLDIRLERWTNPMEFGFYCGDHHIHGAGCAHYEAPTLGVAPADMFVQVQGEGLNVGCVLTWGPCFEFQRQFFSPQADELSQPLTVLKYDLEISGFGSAALGHVCLLNLTDQTYPGSEGTKERGWPTWTVPVLRWCKEQGGVTGYPHSALHVDPPAASQRLLHTLDRDADGKLTVEETALGLLPEPFAVIDEDRDGKLVETELTRANSRAADRLPNLALPAMNGGGAMEILVSTSAGVCDFISAMDTARIPEWNPWYHMLNCGLPIKVSGETDFPCMSSRRVGQGRVYCQLGKVEVLDFTAWCRAIAQGRSYVSDGFAHALDFRVNEVAPGFGDVQLAALGDVPITARVAFAPETPDEVAYGLQVPAAGRRMVGDTVNLHGPRNERLVAGGERLVELVVNGEVLAQQPVPADGQIHDLAFSVPIAHSSWIALRQFPQLHTNPVNVIVAGKPIRASRDSARWCAESIKLLWDNRRHHIAEAEQDAAHEAYLAAIANYEQIAREAE